MRTLKRFVKSLPQADRREIKALTAGYKAEERSLRDMRKALGLTQEAVAGSLGMKQAQISQLENRPDFLLSTLRNYVQALGGELDIVARFPGRKAVRIMRAAELSD